MHRAAAGRIERPPRDLPADLRTLLVGALDPRPERRPSAARLRGGREGTPPRRPAADLGRRRRSPPRWAVAAAVAALRRGRRRDRRRPEPG